MTEKKQTSCADQTEPDAISVEAAINKIHAEINPIKGFEKRHIRSCLNRFLAESIHSPIDVPSHTNSAMDGYAIASSDLPNEGNRRFKITATAYAGSPTTKPYKQGELIRIMTGAVMPKGTDTVIMQEMVSINDDKTISIKANHKAGQNVRHPGEDIKKGSQVLSLGKQITAADLGILASLGIGEINVYRKPRVAFFSTGDELRSIGDIRGAQLNEGEIYDSNRYTLYGMLKNLHVDIIDMGVISDTQEAIQDAFIKASEMADVVITSGGVSVGEADYIKPTLKKFGTTHFWKVAMKPGRPLTFGTLYKNSHSNNCQHSWFFGLPGNPVAVMVTFMQFVQPALQYLASGNTSTPITLQANCESKLYKRAGRTEYQRGIFKQTTDGKLTVKRTGKQGSGILTSMSLANCFIYLASESTAVNEGDIVEIIPFSHSI